MKKILACLLVVACVAPLCVAQSDESRMAALNSFDYKVRKLELYNLLLPLLLSKEQLRAILPPIEKAREVVRIVRKSEVDEIKKLDVKADDALKAAEEKGAVPTKALMDDLHKTR